MPDATCPFSFLVTWFKMSVASHWVTLETPSCPSLARSILFRPLLEEKLSGQTCQPHFRARLALWLLMNVPDGCWWSMKTGCCQSVNGAQAFQFSHGEVCVTEPRGQTHEAMWVYTLLDTQPHTPSSFPDLILRFESENRTSTLLSFSSVILGEGLLSVSLSSPV